MDSTSTPKKKNEKDGTASIIPESKDFILQQEDQNQMPLQYANLFPQIWQRSTTDSNVSLHGFRRFKTSHLVNLRFMEEEIAKIDHKIYQAGLHLGLQPTPVDRLGLGTSKRDANFPKTEETITPALILRLRSMIKEYDQGLAAFNQIMSMETYSLADDGYQSNQRNDLTPREICKTRLLRVDLGPRRTQDPFQRHVHRFIRGIRMHNFMKSSSYDEEANSSSRNGQNISPISIDSILIAGMVGRFMVAILTAAFMIVPLTISAYQNSKSAQLCTIGISVLIFALLVSFSMRTSNHETMAISSAYAAVLSVIVSNGFA